MMGIADGAVLGRFVRILCSLGLRVGNTSVLGRGCLRGCSLGRWKGMNVRPAAGTCRALGLGWRSLT